MRDIDDLIAKGYVQMSRKYRRVAAVPEGKTALEALKESKPELYVDVMRRAEDWAANAYRLYCAEKEGLLITLTWAEFNEFLIKTGRSPMPLEEIKQRAIAKGTFDPAWDEKPTEP